MSKPKSAFRFWNGFKVACGAYLGWNVMTGVDRALVTQLTRKFGSADQLIAKINKWGKEKES